MNNERAVVVAARWSLNQGRRADFPYLVMALRRDAANALIAKELRQESAGLAQELEASMLSGSPVISWPGSSAFPGWPEPLIHLGPLPEDRTRACDPRRG